MKEGGFVKEFVTPIVKASKGGEKQVFFTQTEYESWKAKLGGSTPGWQIKYYKGLGTSKPAEAKKYFENLPMHALLLFHSTPCVAARERPRRQPETPSCP